MPATRVTMVNPGQIVSKKWKGMTTSRKVAEYAKKWKVPTVSWWDPAAKKRTVLVEWNNFYKAWCAWKKEAKKVTKKRRKTTSRRKTRLSVVWSSPKKAKKTVKARRKKVQRRKVRRAA